MISIELLILTTSNVVTLVALAILLYIPKFLILFVHLSLQHGIVAYIFKAIFYFRAKLL